MVRERSDFAGSNNLPVKAKEWYPPHATWITRILFRLGTSCGLQSLKLLPLPSSKFEFAGNDTRNANIQHISKLITAIREN